MVAIRPMRFGDAEAVDDVCCEVLYDRVAPAEEPARRARSLLRIRHVLETDPGGSWVAERDGAVCGAALAIVREEIWGLSLFAVGAAEQGRGVGRRLLDAALAHGGEAVRGRIVLSSGSPAAMRLYARAGMRLRPCVAAAGIVDVSARAPDGVARVVDAGEAAIPLADEIGRAVRGAGHGRDLPAMLAGGARLLTFADRAFCVTRDGPWLLAARDDEAARLALWAALLHAGPGASVTVDYLTAEQAWAIEVCLDAGLALSPDGPLFTSRRARPARALPAERRLSLTS
jgi:predicted N-acetyltransferase YhbS